MSQNSQLTRAVVRWQLKAPATLNLHWHPGGGGDVVRCLGTVGAGCFVVEDWEEQGQLQDQEARTGTF